MAVTTIPTEWDGFRFRSRLEARWACFFGALGIRFYYEPEGFKLSSGALYLPDFLLPHINYWAEVKPVSFGTSELLKCEDLAHDSGRPVLILEGPPDFRTYHAIFPYIGQDRASVTLSCLLDIDYHSRVVYEEQRRLFADPGNGFTQESDFTPQYREAVHYSRAQRFGVHE